MLALVLILVVCSITGFNSYVFVQPIEFWPEIVSTVCFPTIQDLGIILDRTNVRYDNFQCWQNFGHVHDKNISDVAPKSAPLASSPSR